MAERDWRPKKRLFRSVMLYCSPACGYKCTYESYLEEKKKAKALLDLMVSGGWEADVWENMGWHHALRHRKLEIGLHGDPSRYSFSGPVSLIGDVPAMKDPNKMVNKLIKHMQREAKRVTNALATLENK